MAKGKRGGRGGGRKGRRAAPAVGRATTAQPPVAEGRRRSKSCPRRAPGAHGLPSSIMGGHASVDLSRAAAGAIRRPGLRRRNRGGPRTESERIARGPRVIYDFRYVRADLRWIALTSAASVGAVLLAWLALRV